MVDVISILFTIGYFIILINLFFFTIPVANKDTANMLIGLLSTIMISIVHNYFNNSGVNDEKPVDPPAHS
jgi:hypothetical protein